MNISEYVVAISKGFVYSGILLAVLAIVSIFHLDSSVASANQLPKRADSCVLGTEDPVQVAKCIDYYERIILTGRVVSSSDEAKAASRARCRGNKDYRECSRQVHSEFFARTEPVRTISRALESGSCTSIYYHLRNADRDLKSGRKSFLGRFFHGYEACDFAAQVAQARVGALPVWHQCRSDGTPEGFRHCVRGFDTVQNFVRTLTECGTMDDRITFLVTEANEMAEKAHFETTRSGKRKSFRCGDVRRAAAAFYADEIDAALLADTAAPAHVPGNPAPNARDVELAFAPHFGRLYPMIGQNCDVSSRDGCELNVLTARVTLTIAGVRNITCSPATEAGLVCDFILRLSCRSNDPSNAFCAAFGQPYPYSNVRFVREPSRWRIASISAAN